MPGSHACSDRQTDARLTSREELYGLVMCKLLEKYFYNKGFVCCIELTLLLPTYVPIVQLFL